MANGRTHDRITLITAGCTVAIGFILGEHAVEIMNSSQSFAVARYHPSFPILTGLGALINLWIGPDLDLSGGKAKRWWGPLKMLWYPYGKLIPHRHVLSHFPVIGTFGRVVYFSLPLLPAMGCPGFIMWTVTWWAQPILFGLLLADMMHWVADGMPVRV